MSFPRHGMHLPQAQTQERSIPHLKKFGLAMYKKNQGLAQKINYKGKMMIKPTQQISRNSTIRRSLTQGRNQIKRKICQKYNVSTAKNMVTTRIIVELNKRKETHDASVSKGREPSKKAKQDKTKFFF
jgi:hypothetical protein